MYYVGYIHTIRERGRTTPYHAMHVYCTMQCKCYSANQSYSKLSNTIRTNPVQLLQPKISASSSSFCPCYLLQPQIIHNHIATQPNPPPTEPPHLTLMRIRHRRLRSAHFLNAAQEEQWRRMLIHLFLARNNHHQTYNRVKETRIFPHDIHRRKGV